LDQRIAPAAGTSILFAVLLLFLTTREAIADYDQGLQAYAAGNYSEAVTAWSEPALADNPQAQFALGVLHMRGVGVPRNEAAAVAFYRRAAQAGLASARFNLGLAYFAGTGVDRDPEQALQWWRQAANQGHVVAQYNLGALLWGGDGVQQDQARAMHWFRTARSNGSEDASGFLLTLFEPMYQELTEDTLERVRGDSNRSIPLIDEFGLYKLGVQAIEKGDYAQAFGYWQPLAQDGHAESQYQVAQLYEHGRGVEENFDQAMVWYDRAAQQNHGEAQFRLGLYHINESPDPNEALGFYWIQSAADNGSTRARAYIDAD
jgi:TPR repeat protein